MGVVSRVAALVRHRSAHPARSSGSHPHVARLGQLVHRATRPASRATHDRAARRARVPRLRGAHRRTRPARPPRSDQRSGHPAPVPLDTRGRTRRHAATAGSRRPRRHRCAARRRHRTRRRRRHRARCSRGTAAAAADERPVALRCRPRPAGLPTTDAARFGCTGCCSPPSPPAQSRSPHHEATCARRRRSNCRGGSHRGPTVSAPSHRTTPESHRRRSRRAPSIIACAAALAARRRRPPLIDLAVAGDDMVLQRGLRLLGARTSDALTAYDGDLSSVDVPALTDAVSPSRLETWSACPHAYFDHYLLDVEPVDEPGDEISITARDRGTAHHGALDLFHQAVVDGTLPNPGQPDGPTNTAKRSPRSSTRCASAPNDAAARAVPRSGPTNAPACSTTSSPGFATTATWSCAAGPPCSRPRCASAPTMRVSIELADGRRVKLLGSIDRVDRTRDGQLVVTDHKTGGKAKFKDLSSDDPTAGGTLFQLPSYAAAARARFGGARHAGAGRVRPAAQGRLCPTGLSDRRRRRRTGGRVVGARRRWDRERLLPQPARAARMAVLRRLPLLRTRWLGHRRALGRVAAQTARCPTRPVVRRRPTRPNQGRRRANPHRLTVPPVRRHRPTRPNARGSASDLDATLFVEAGAGAGKTSSLVARIVNLVRSGCRSPVSPRSRSPRRRPPSCAAAPASASKPTVAPTPTRRSTGSTTPRSARCTRSPAGSCSTSRSTPGCHPASPCSTNSRATWRSRSSGTTCSIVCSTRPNRQAD